MTPIHYTVIVFVVLLILGEIIFPQTNKLQIQKMTEEEQIRLLMKEANKLIYFKNISNGTSGTLVYIKNRRKIYTYPWVLRDGKMVCTRRNLYQHWDYPDNQPEFTQEEIEQAVAELNKYNDSNIVKLYIEK